MKGWQVNTTLRAFTLVEVLIALALGTLVIAAVLGYHAQGRAALQSSEALALIGEQARYAFATLEADLQMAGYYGLGTTGDDFRFLQTGDVAAASTASALRQGSPALAGLPATAQSCGRQFAVDLATPIEASNNHYATGQAATAACNPHPPGATSDTLTIRRAATGTASAEAGRLQLLVDRSDPLLRFVLADGMLPPTAVLTAGQLELHDLVTRFYYIATDSDGSPGTPALRVKTLGRVAGRPTFIDTEVMSGIEDLQIEFRTAGGYVAPDALPVGVILRGVRLWLRLRSANPEAGHVDERSYRYADTLYTPAGSERSYRRLLSSHVIAVRNVPYP